jgi:hypothetical protein
VKAFLTRLYANAGTVSKFLIAIASDVQVNMHTGWTSPTGIITDVLAFAVWLVPNAPSSIVTVNRSQGPQQ